MKENLDIICDRFSNYFCGIGYEEKNPVEISSGYDNTVTLIGSGISVLKSYLLTDVLCSPGVFIRQKAVRTHPLKSLTELKEGIYASFFEAFCVLTHYERLERLIQETVYFFVHELGVEMSDILFRISSSDIDLLQCVKALNGDFNIEIDSKEQSYYKHKYGLDKYGIYGRNLNFTVMKNNIAKCDIGNIIVIEKEHTPIAVELALGCQTTAMALYGIPKSIQANYIADIISLKTTPQRKFADALVVTSNLEHENIHLCKHRYPVYLYRKYWQGLKYWQKYLDVKDEVLVKWKKDYLNMEYNRKYREF